MATIARLRDFMGAKNPSVSAVTLLYNITRENIWLRHTRTMRLRIRDNLFFLVLNGQRNSRVFFFGGRHCSPGNMLVVSHRAQVNVVVIAQQRPDHLAILVMLAAPVGDGGIMRIDAGIGRDERG